MVIGIIVDGRRDVLEIWVGDGWEGAKYWLAVLTKIKNPGTTDVFIVACDGLVGPGEAITTVWPQTIVQTSVLHLICKSFRYASREYWDQMARDLRPIYSALTEAGRRGAVRRVPRAVGPGSIQRSSRSGTTPGRSSCPSSTTTWRSARSSAARTRSIPRTPVTDGRPGPEGTLPHRAGDAEVPLSSHALAGPDP